jgi:uncharacterized protein (TIGR03435 family)
VKSILRSVMAAGACAGLMQAVIAAQLPLPAAGPGIDPNLQFEAASIKPFDATSGPIRMMMQPGRLEASGIPVRLLLRQALRVQDYQIINAPSWIDTERYAIVAKAPAGAPPAANAVMITNLLKDRFKLAMHTETRELPIFHLVLARSDKRLGPSLKESSPECAEQVRARAGGPGRGPGGPGPGGPDGPGGAGGPGGPGGPGGAVVGRGGPPVFDPNAPIQCGSMRLGPGMSEAGGQGIAQLVQMLSQTTGRPVIDKTGLTGIYDFSLKYLPESGANNNPFGPAPPGITPPAIDPDAPNLYTAVQEQLGLKLESQRGPVEVFIIDRIEKPTLD